jgi:hypothetical protein
MKEGWKDWLIYKQDEWDALLLKGKLNGKPCFF